MLGLTLIAAGILNVATAGGASASGQVDACALLTAAEVTPLVPGAKPTASTSTANGGPTSVCDWSAAGGGLPTLQVSVTPDSPALKQGLGANRDYLKMVFQKDAEENSGRLLADLGDLAKVESVIQMSAETTVVLGTTWVVVEYSGQGAKGKQDQVVALARSVVKRLQGAK
jgi:hypothetical protein